jgi:hypothetical protein
MNEFTCDRERVVIRSLIEHRVEYLDKQINEGFMKAYSRNEFKLSTIETFIVVMYKEVNNKMRLYRDGFQMINGSILALSDDNSGILAS